MKEISDFRLNLSVFLSKMENFELQHLQIFPVAVPGQVPPGSARFTQEAGSLHLVILLDMEFDKSTCN